MAHVWIQDESGWNAAKLGSTHFDLGSLCALVPTEVSSASGDAKPAPVADAGLARLVKVDETGAEVWALVTSPGSAVRVNGRSPTAGLCVLADRDEICVGISARCFFSTETLVIIAPFPGLERDVFCGRCRQRIEKGAPAVRCPGCGVWYNESPDLPCWTYAAKCVFCETRTALDAGFLWTPEG